MKRSAIVILVLLLFVSAAYAYTPHIPGDSNKPGPNDNEAPIAQIFMETDGCQAKEPCKFYAHLSYDNDGTIVQHRWDMEDGTVVSGFYEGITHTYKVPGQYLVTLRVWDDDGAMGITSKLITVSGSGGGSGTSNYPPTATILSPADGATFDPYELITIQYKGTDSYWISSYELKVDGTVVKAGLNLGESFTHSYTSSFGAEGDHTVVLLVTDHKGLTASDSITIKINQPDNPPVVKITYPVDGSTFSIGTTLPIRFEITDDTKLTYYTVFVDGTQVAQENISGTRYEGSVNLTIEKSVDHTILVEAFDIEDNKGSDSVTIHVKKPNRAPSVSIIKPGNGDKIEKDTTFNVEFKITDDKGLSRYELFADGQIKKNESISGTSFEKEVTLSFSSTGNRTIEVKAWDTSGKTGSRSVTVEITKASSKNLAPIAKPSVSPTRVQVGDPAWFTSDGEDPDGYMIYLFEWDYETDSKWDYSYTEPRTHQHIYMRAGDYTTTLRVTDEEGATDTDTVDIEVYRDWCSENDDGMDFWKYSATYASGIEKTKYDVCSGDILYEAYCSEDLDDDEPHVTTVNCDTYMKSLGAPKGACNLGACVPIGNVPPTADAGPDVTVKPGETIVLDGSGSFDLDGEIVKYEWKNANSGTVFSYDKIHQEVLPNTTYTSTETGVVLTVTDDSGATDSDYATVFIEN